MDSRLGVVAVIISDYEKVQEVNSLLHEARDYIIGRIGIPYKAKNVCVISVVIDAPNEYINALSGKLGQIKGVSSKILVTK